MEKSDFQSNLKGYLTAYAQVWRLFQRTFDTPSAVAEVCELRHYYDYPQMESTLTQQGIVKVSGSALDLDLLMTLNDKHSLGLFSDPRPSDGKRFLVLDGRYTLPIRDIAGNVIALVGWYPDNKKYITAGGMFFSKSTLFYGLERLYEGSQPTVIVEGIFDRLALESAGIRAFATMGSNADPKKRVLYNLMGRVIAMPDSDTTGQKVVKYDSWAMPSNSSYLTLKNTHLVIEGEDFFIKDVDMLGKLVDSDYIKGIVTDAYQQKNRRNISVPLNFSG